MEIVLYIYFGINIFLSGYWFNENDRWESRKYAIIFSSVALLFAVLISVFLLFLKLFAPILGWLYKEITFQYKFYFTNYWDKILLDDNYSEEYKTREEKLEWLNKIRDGYSKQMIRHNKQVQKKYGN